MVVSQESRRVSATATALFLNDLFDIFFARGRDMEGLLLGTVETEVKFSPNDHEGLHSGPESAITSITSFYEWDATGPRFYHQDGSLDMAVVEAYQLSSLPVVGYVRFRPSSPGIPSLRDQAVAAHLAAHFNQFRSRAGIPVEPANMTMLLALFTTPPPDMPPPMVSCAPLLPRGITWSFWEAGTSATATGPASDMKSVTSRPSPRRVGLKVITSTDPLSKNPGPLMVRLYLKELLSHSNLVEIAPIISRLGHYEFQREARPALEQFVTLIKEAAQRVRAEASKCSPLEDSIAEATLARALSSEQVVNDSNPALYSSLFDMHDLDHSLEDDLLRIPDE
ncbi:hypothetical protein IWQ60_010171 [Tieghemiomyces parasiticus]|uniref:Uncharacterized protein n=1 Tax=Tieghemiomyces parasiticus TaxID=78921 RepID=A0A9W7ZR32_9FUNG|nr:hypothetical protein IWQ60_010171 [Tieghemiomyces parasiticus]